MARQGKRDLELAEAKHKQEKTSVIKSKSEVLNGGCGHKCDRCTKPGKDERSVRLRTLGAKNPWAQSGSGECDVGTKWVESKCAPRRVSVSWRKIAETRGAAWQ